MLIAEGADFYAPGGRLIQGGERVVYPGLDKAMELMRDEGSSSFYAGTLAEALLDLMAERGGAITAGDLAAYDVIESQPGRAGLGGYTIHARRDLLDLLATVSRLPAGIATMGPGQRYVSLVTALRDIPDLLPGTSSMVAVDAAGNACAGATSLGLGSGDWLPGFGIHCNSMLGEGELMHGSQQPGDRVPSMMVPLLALDDNGLAMAASAAGGSRIRSSLIQVLMGVLTEGLLPQEAVDRPRVNPVRDRVHAELGIPDEVVRALEADGHPVERWTRRAAYFGGVSAVSRAGAAADPRRGGAVAYPDGDVVSSSLNE
jgi:gamma-glutamyltranspeptidase/glutathione hydrolase